MKKSDWQKLAAASADPVRVKYFLDLLVVGGVRLEGLPAESMRALTAVLAGSAALGNVLVANPGWLSVFDPERLKFPRRAQGIQREVEGGLKPKLETGDFAGALAGLRRFKHREMLRIAARDLARLGEVAEITREISDVADACLNAVWQICRRQLAGRSGEPWHQDTAGRWRRTEFCVLGLGKLGGQELNYSSDVDVLFLYGEEGEVFKEPPGNKNNQRARMSNHQYFNKCAEAFIAEISRLTPDGMLFRIDLRLRPEGDAGPLCRSLGSYENYYAQWGQTWERMMLIKARGVAGDVGLAAEFLEMIQPFRYPPAINAGVLGEVAALKDRIEKEIVGADALDRNVKLGRGGIREIEFIAQSLQILHAGRLPFLQTAQTLPCLAKLAQYKLLTIEEAQELAAAYRFLRDVEHRLQMEENQQTHTIPADPPAQRRLARLMGFRSLAAFESALQKHTGNVRRVYDRLLKAEWPKASDGLPPEFAGAEEEWKKLLARHSFRDPETAFRLLQEFAEGPGYVLVSSRTTELARQLVPRLLALCPRLQGQSGISNRPSAIGHRPVQILSDPDRVLTRLDSFVSAYGTRAPLLELWSNHPAMFELMLLLFDRSEFLAEVAIRTPDLIDDLIVGGRLRQRKTVLEILKDLRHGLADADQFLWLRRYHEAEQMRLGLRDILGLADFEQNLVELSALADACLQYALAVVMRKSKIKTPPFVIIGLGKLGGGEIDYGSDLDILFVTDAPAKALPKLQQLAVDVMDLLSRRTEQGVVFYTDARLRPDGEKGLLVNTLAAYENYYRQRARLWEIQALVRTRPVAGNLSLGGKFQRLAATLTDFKSVSSGGAGEMRLASNVKSTRTPYVVSCTPDWKMEIHRMRMRIEKERTPPGQDDLAIKTGKGGLMDAEFIAQALCLENGWPEANTLRALERAREAGALPDGEKLLDNYRQLRHVEGILRRWSYEGETVLPDEPAPYYRVSVRCGFATPEKFRKALAMWRKAIRTVYAKVFEAD
ncbi:MAG: bifunctional [glutamate--ammonia ligase]-adenylyl-L-tyrosine phosphorylase/[glutamate--ammonia-ligase] adenylyltransferase [Verrucomicrobiia bacterium]